MCVGVVRLLLSLFLLGLEVRGWFLFTWSAMGSEKTELRKHQRRVGRKCRDKTVAAMAAAAAVAAMKVQDRARLA
jgi:hypothetical protein